jgi:hypothetical protein
VVQTFGYFFKNMNKVKHWFWEKNGWVHFKVNFWQTLVTLILTATYRKQKSRIR